MIESSDDGHVAAPVVRDAVKVKSELLHVRTENAFGLFETVSVQAVMVRVVV